MVKVSILAAKSTELVALLEILGSEKRCFFLKKKPDFLKTAKHSQFDVDCTETVSQFGVECERNSEISQNAQKLCFLQRKMRFPNKTLKFSKIADGNKFAVQWEGISKVSQNVQILGFGKFKEYLGFPRKPEVF